MMTLSYDEPMLAVLDNAHIPALSVSLSKHNNVTHFEGGITDTSNPQPVNASTLFSASSLSKPVSAAIVLDLAQQHSWDLNTPLAEIGDYGTADIQNDDNYHKLTIGMVLGQCSGLPNWIDENTEPFIATPGERFGYSGVAFDYLKEVIEKNSKINKSWEELAQDFFNKNKIDMKNSTFKQCEASHLSGRMVARGHQGDGTPELIAPVNSPEVPAASLLTTAEDYMLFLQYCYADPFLKSTLLSTHSIINDNKYPNLPEGMGKITWGLGMGIYQDDKREIAFHWGNNPGSTSCCAINLKTGDAVACFTNSDNGPNVFQIISQPVMGDMQPVFGWLSAYCNFNSKIKAESLEALREQLSNIMDLPQEILFLTSETDQEKILAIKAEIEHSTPDSVVSVFQVNALDGIQASIEKINSDQYSAVVFDDGLAVHPWNIIKQYKQQASEQQNTQLKFIISGEVESLTQSFCAAEGLVGNALVVKEGEKLIETCYGDLRGSDVEITTSQPLEINTQHNMCSIGKMLTGLTLLKLAEKNPDILGQYIFHYLPEDFPDRASYRWMTVGHLLTHTSGMGDYADKYHHVLEDSSQPNPALNNLADFVPFVGEKPTADNETFSYSNLGFVVLGEIIQQVYNADHLDAHVENYWEVIEEMILKPADVHISRDTPDPSTSSASNDAFPTARQIASSPAGGNLWTTTEELAKFSAWVSAQYHDDPAFKTMVESLKELAVKFDDGSCYSFGMFQKTVEGETCYCHSGAAPGISSVLHIYPENNSAIIVFLNSAKEGAPAYLLAEVLESNVLKSNNIHYVNGEHPFSVDLLSDGVENIATQKASL